MNDPTTFRWDAEFGVLWVGERSYPAIFHRESAREHLPARARAELPHFRMETRQATVVFENEWKLSTIWGDATYSSNSMWFTPHDREQRPFIEEPTLVEVGVLVPDALTFVRPAETHELPTGTVEMPERSSTLWGDPLGYVDVPTFHRVADMVMMLPTVIDLPEGEWDSAEGFCDLLITAGLERTL